MPSAHATTYNRCCASSTARWRALFQPGPARQTPKDESFGTVPHAKDKRDPLQFAATLGSIRSARMSSCSRRVRSPYVRRHSPPTARVPHLASPAGASRWLPSSVRRAGSSPGMSETSRLGRCRAWRQRPARMASRARAGERHPLSQPHYLAQDSDGSCRGRPILTPSERLPALRRRDRGPSKPPSCCFTPTHHGGRCRRGFAGK